MNSKTLAINLINMLFIGLMISLLLWFNNIVATILISFIVTNIMLITNEVLETKLLHKDSKLITAINEINHIENKSEKLVNIITLFYPSIFTTIFAVIIHTVYLLLT